MEMGWDKEEEVIFSVLPLENNRVRILYIPVLIYEKKNSSLKAGWTSTKNVCAVVKCESLVFFENLTTTLFTSVQRKQQRSSKISFFVDYTLDNW